MRARAHDVLGEQLLRELDRALDVERARFERRADRDRGPRSLAEGQGYRATARSIALPAASGGSATWLGR